MSHHIDTGRNGEEFAANYLSERGYQIIEKNYTCKIGEIDIIALDGDILVFVEVKTRNTDAQGSPLEAVTPRKQKAIIKVAQWYIMEEDIDDQQIRFDVLGIMNAGGCCQIDLIQNAFDVY